MASSLGVFCLGVHLLLGAVDEGQDVILKIDDVPPDGLVVADVDLTAAMRWCKLAGNPAGVLASTEPDGRNVVAQWVPGVTYEPQTRLTGTLVMQLPSNTSGRVRLKFSSTVARPEAWDGRVQMLGVTLTHDAKRQGGFPSRIQFADGTVFDSLRWNDRLFDRKLGSFSPTADRDAKVTLVSKGPLCTAVRVVGRYLRPDGKAPQSTPIAVYDWLYLNHRPLARLNATMTQSESFSWPEIHVWELDYPREAFAQWAGGEPVQQGEFTATKKSFHLPQWSAVLNQNRAIGLMQCGQPILYDGGPGTYLQAHGDAAWKGWDQTRRESSAWLWLGSDPKPVEAIRTAAKGLPSSARTMVTVKTVRQRIEQAAADRTAEWWRTVGAEQLESQGDYDGALQAIAGKQPVGWTVLTAGKLGLILQRTDGGLRVANLCDIAARRQLLHRQSLPLFELTVRKVGAKETVVLPADLSWTKCDVRQLDGSRETEIVWQSPADHRLGELRVVANVACDVGGAFRWRLRVERLPADWSVWQVRFPQVAVRNLGPQSCVLFPRGAGEVQQDVTLRTFRYRGTYPSGWTTMQFLAAYDKDGKTGLYLGSHDPWGSTKEILAESRPTDQALLLAFEHPAPGMGEGGNRFELSGEAVWQLLQGDWFDAAVIYRDWVRRDARWYPQLGPDGRADTPLWMRELSVWALGGGAPRECVERVKEFARYLGVPVGFHWYSWHQIPFDNDYPHYFPTKDGFAAAVGDLQASSVYVMPYINGRLWDTRDKGTEDFEFTRVALPATTKDEEGKPYVEMYGSKESDGSRVQLAAMCPSTELWKRTQREIVMRLFGECGVKGVYMDQIAAAKPPLCFDRTHGHPLGGGHWWTESYWSLLESIRQAKPADRILTTECNAEPYIRMFDGYLTWHWQYDGQVPAFPAVYGGSVQMFGRAYRGGDTKELALRMKAGQQLVYGEQIGWLDPGVVRHPDQGEFLRQVVRLRHALRRYFYAGEMARPPRITGSIPRVTADWQWSGKWPVTTDALLTGAWRLPAEKKLVLMIVNVGAEAIDVTLAFNAATYGLPPGSLRMTRIDQNGASETQSVERVFHRSITAAPRQAWAWEISVP